MRHRNRVLVALLALLTLSATLVEGALVSLCASGPVADHPVTAEGLADRPYPGSSHHTAPEGSPTAPSSAPDCPMAMSGATPCAGGFLPPEPGHYLSFGTSLEREIAPLPDLLDRLSVAAHFRPPRA